MYLHTIADFAERWQLGFQDPATPIMEGIIHFHNDLMFFLILIVVFIMWMLGRCVYFFDATQARAKENFVHGTAIEIIWTTIPAILLFFIAIPSFALLYSMDEIIDPELTLKVVGHQWYWSYELSFLTVDVPFEIQASYFASVPEDQIEFEIKDVLFDSYMVSTDDLEIGQLRLLEVDNRVVLPINMHVRVLITSSDVLHSWAIPSLGLKLDACPGRLNQTSVFLKREGVYYGQCSEICGINHGFMPIVVEAVTYEDFGFWADDQLKGMNR